MITLFYDSTSKDITPLDTSYRYRSLMGENTLTLIFEDADFFEIPLGAYCDFEGERYTLIKPENFKKEGSRKYTYTLILDGPQGGLRKYKMRDGVDKQLKFSLTAKPHEHLQLLVDNLNERETGWAIGEFIDATEKVISYNHTSLDAAIRQIADAFETEWEIQGKTIHLRKVEYNKSAPLSLAYGKGNGFLPGVGRANSEETNAVEILFVQGGERNINFSDYGSRELRLPKNASMTFEGRQYVTDSLGMYITRGDKALETHTEDSLDCSHIYPSRVGEVSGVEVVNEDNNKYDFFDTSIPEDLDFKACLIAGQSLTVKFETGILAGREFDVDYKHAEKRFLLVPQEVDGVTMPNATFQPAIGDKYAVFGMQMPSQYISDDATQTGASWDMFREGVRYLYEHENPRFSFTGEMDGIWSKQNWLNVGGKIVLGGYVRFSDPAFQPDGIDIRIIGIRQPINNPYSPIIELSNAPSAVSVASELKKIKANEVVVDDKVKEVRSYTKRRYRESQETIEMLSEAVTGFTNGINPLSVKTMSLIVGSEALQFRFVDSQTAPTEIIHSITFDTASKVLSADAGTVQHMTIGINTLISGGRSADEYTFWDVTAFDSPPLTDPSKRYYLYIKASKADSTAEFYLSETPIGMEEESGFYDFLVGFLNSESDGERSFARMHGFTEVLPGRISTSKIHADTVEATQVLAEEIYASGAQIGGIDISPDDLITGLDGIRLGTATRFGPYTGEAGILLGVDNSGGSPIYKAFIGNSQSFLHYDGTDLIISQDAKIIGGTTFKDISDISRFLRIGGEPGSEYLYSELPIASAGDITAYSETAFVSTIWESMPIASATINGGVKIGEGINVDSSGVISVDSTSLSPQTLGLVGNTLSISDGNSVDLSGLSPDLTGYATETWVSSNYLSKTGKAADSDKLDGLDSSAFIKANTSALSITGTISASGSATIGTQLYVNDYLRVNGNDDGTAWKLGVTGDALVRGLFRTIGGGALFDGNTGIKTTSPSQTLDVEGTGRFTGTLYANGHLFVGNSSSSNYIFIDAATTQQAGLIFRKNSNSEWLIRQASNSDKLKLYSYGYGDDILTVSPAARLGVKQEYPVHTLDVGGDGRFTGNLYAAEFKGRAEQIYIYDARYMSGTDGSSNYMPLPSSSLFSNSITGIFSYDWGGEYWGSVLSMKGWNSSYSAWQLGGTANSSVTDDNLYFRTGDDTWGDWRKVAVQDVDGNLLVDGSVRADTYFRSADNAIVLGTASAGTVYLRPNSYGVTTGQAALSSDGRLKLQYSAGGSNQGEILLQPKGGSGGSPQIGFTDHGDMSWAFGGDDGDNSFKIHGVASSIIPTIYGLNNPLFELTTTGELRVAGDIVAYA